MTTRKITDTIDHIKQRLHTTSEDDAIPLMQHAHSAPTPETTAKHVKQPSHGKFSLSSEDQFSLSEFLFSLRWMAAPILLIMLTYHYFVVPGLDKHMQLLMPQYVVFFFWILIWGYYSWATLIRRCYLSSYWHTLATQAWFCYQILTFFGPILPRFFTGEHPRPFGLFMLVCLGSNILVWCCQVFVEGIYFLYLAFRWATGPKAKARPHAEDASKRNQQVGDNRAIKDPHAIQVNRYKTVIILSLALAMTFASLNPLQDLPMVVRIKQPLRGLQEKHAGMTILQISDVHLGASTGRDFFERLVSQIRHLPDRIDLIAFTGDLVDGPIENYGSSIEPLEDLKGVAKYGSYYCTGNHEYISGTIFRWYEKIASHGVKVLHNQRDRIAGDAFDLVGIDDLTAIYYGDETNGHGANLTKALVDTSYAPLGEFGEVPIILMAHQPEHVHLAVAGNVDLHLSGHTHGGQFWPMHIPVWLGNPYLSGLHKHFNTWIYVSRGAGAWGPPMRLLAPHEITIFTLVPDKGQEPIITKTTGQASFDPAAVVQV